MQKYDLKQYFFYKAFINLKQTTINHNQIKYYHDLTKI